MTSGEEAGISGKTKADDTKHLVDIAKISFWQAAVGALIAGVFGVLGGYLKLVQADPATGGRIEAAFDRGVPIGVIVASTLPPREFARAAGDSGSFDPRTTTWVPADGRRVPGSDYAKVVSTTAPDLRGMFLRGLNYSEADRIRADGSEDPDGANRAVGDMQQDSIRSHKHVLDDPGHSHTWGPAVKERNVYGKGGERSAWGHVGGKPLQSGGSSTDVTMRFEGGSETRPRNVAVYYYVRINYSAGV